MCLKAERTIGYGFSAKMEKCHTLSYDISVSIKSPNLPKIDKDDLFGGPLFLSLLVKIQLSWVLWIAFFTQNLHLYRLDSLSI